MSVTEPPTSLPKQFLIGALVGATFVSTGFALGCWYTKLKIEKLNKEEPKVNFEQDDEIDHSISRASSRSSMEGPGINITCPSPIHHNYHKPKRIFLIRHGESEGNVNPNIYSVKPDNKIELTKLGLEQADEAGKKLKEIIGDESVIFMISPYKRSVQTFEKIAAHFGGKEHVVVKEDPRLREQDFGNFQDPNDMRNRQEERRRFGSFYYRFPQGEAGSDVYCRVSSMCGTLFRSMETTRQNFDNYVLVSHGLTCRLFLMRYFQWSVDTFHSLWNLSNCQIVCMELQPNGKYKLLEKLKCDDETLLPQKDFVCQTEDLDNQISLCL